MTENPKQPVEQRIKDIVLWAVLILGSSFLYGNIEIFKLTLPLFIILSSIFATGRYRKSKDFPHQKFENQRKQRRDLFIRQHILNR